MYSYFFYLQHVYQDKDKLKDKIKDKSNHQIKDSVSCQTEPLEVHHNSKIQRKFNTSSRGKYLLA